MSVLNNFNDWKSFLAQRVTQSASSGVGEDAMQNMAYEIGDYLSAHVDPKNEQERLLKELWDAGNEQEQRAMAGVMVKYVQGQNRTS
ncbi:DUF3243 domain-containing protein [Aneurinibacillus sp. Ricciae_BoGa-3]|uniref:DUF3243 domain-containing protein n=1 Tax=Aneurinibacillus sp. Ricciae_BoGa-3 TaxID=3022697 RepID=UPI002341BEC9|nr:DUF3243 domain-containing protein [Aneurinibacillus sp. Ricciae_BoGa-3]WCK56138.1 DUF3243 domain-containing protein [Aneurinibacillus sp. Ricciae_BoGa-3]